MSVGPACSVSSVDSKLHCELEYRNQPPLHRSTELDLPYPNLQEYIADMNVMMALIINGPV